MNEITKIHLGRQAFTIAIDAHKALQRYLHEIEHESNKDVVGEVELRMAELLTERGIGADKVVILDDISYLKNQLGEPDDFKEDGEPERSDDENVDGKAPKRLFRDTEHGMIAGVAAGLAAYIGVDAVIVRLLFALAVITGGWGILAYLIFWLIMPEAKTKSDRLRMKGLAVTVDSLKQVVDRADVPGAAKRVTTMMGRVVTAVCKIVLAVLGIGFLLAGLAAAIWTVVASVYVLITGVQIAGEVIFPVGGKEIMLLLCGAVASMLLSALLFILGLTMMRRTWVVPGWAMGVMVGVFFLATSVGTALGFDAAPRIQAQYKAMHHTQTIVQPAFTAVQLTGANTRYAFKQGSAYSVEVHYFGKLQKKFPISTTVVNGTLSVDTSEYQRQLDDCTFLCLYNGNDFEVIINAPSLAVVTMDQSNVSFRTVEPLEQQVFILEMSSGSYANVSMSGTTNVQIDTTKRNGIRSVMLTNLGTPVSAEQNWLWVSDGSVNIGYAPEVTLKTNDTCDVYQPLVYLANAPQKLTINGQPATAAMQTGDDSGGRTLQNCVTLREIYR